MVLRCFLIIAFLIIFSSAHAEKVRYDDLPDPNPFSTSFQIQGNAWDHTNLTYFFQNGTPDIAGNNERIAIQQAFSLWAAVTPLTFTEVNNAGSADIVVVFAAGDHGDGSNFDGVNGILAHAFYPPPNGGAIAGDMHFDEAETWTDATRGNGSQPIDLVTVAAHELGHSLGLQHSNVSGALMDPFYGGSHRFLHQDDIDGIQSIYGDNFNFDSPDLWVGSFGYDAGGWRTENHPRTMADVNGDGLDDIVGFGNAGVYVSLSTGVSFTSPALWVGSYGYNAGGWRVNRHPRLLGDVNGDGRDDIVGFGNAGAYVSVSTGTSFTSPSLWVGSYGYDAGGWRVENHPRFLADVNGDGRDDIVGFGNAGTYVSLSNGNSFSSPALWVGSYGYNAGGWRTDQHPRVLADVNSDGRADIVGFGNAGTYVSVSTGSSFSSPSLWVASYGYNAGGWRVENHPRMVADVNGDGFNDIVGFGNAGVYVSLSDGHSFSSPVLWVGSYGYNAGGWRTDRHPRFLADVDNDGRADVVGMGNAGTYVSLSTGFDFTAPKLEINNYGYNAGGWRVANHPRIMADVNGDDKADIVGFGNAGAYVSLNLFP
ncbi:MAG: matrixin family metalloprotease [Exilibacterium sp.]